MSSRKYKSSRPKRSHGFDIICVVSDDLEHSTQALNCIASTFASVLPSNATLLQAVFVPQGGTFGNGGVNLPFPPGNGTDLGELCAVEVNVTTSTTSSYRFGLFLPTNWNQRYLATGNGGFGGGINWPGLGTYTRYGFAAMSTDTGHSSTVFDGTWAINNTEGVIDWGYRAMHGSIVLSKQLTDVYYGDGHKYSYYSGCSTGGRQGFKEIEEYPSDFDGVLAGAPAWWTTRLQPWSIQVGLYNLPANSSHHISNDLMKGVVAAEVLRQCDPQDGVTDSIISQPYSCNFYPETLLCTPTSNISACLNPDQIKTLYKLYSPWVETNQTFVFPSLPLGSEAENSFLFDVTTVVSSAGTMWVGPFLYNTPTYDPTNNFSYATVQYADAINPGSANADNFDLTPFRTNGGKVIQYHGYADGLITAGSSIYLYKQIVSTLSTLGINSTLVDEFYRLFLIPGMQHCGGSVNNAPWVFAGDGQNLNSTSYSVPGFLDPDHDALLSLMRWVENGTAPDMIVATKFENDSPTGSVVSQRPLCPFPQIARWDGIGDVKLADSWACGSAY